MSIDGTKLIEWGFEPGQAFGEMLAVANAMEGSPEEQILEAMHDIYADYEEEIEYVALNEPGSVDVKIFLDEGRNEFEIKNNETVLTKMENLTRVPTIVDAAIMPDACPSGPGAAEIPVGGVAVAKNAIHPGMHSADICCSLFLTEFDQDIDVSKILDTVQKESHFGYGGRQDVTMGYDHHIIKRAKENRFLASAKMFKAMSEHLGTQGDGNHFFYVGRSEKTGSINIVTHHGSRNPGALLYKEGMRVADQFRKKLCPDVDKYNAWIPFDTDEGQWYWEALQIIREWTKYNHTVIHDRVMRALGMSPKNITDRFWNEHNFVFKSGDLFYHAKGSTPMYDNYSHDADHRRIIPLNMGEPILIVKNSEQNDFGFAPHGAGRNMSRTQFKKMNGNKTVEEIMKEQVGHIDARFYTGDPDASELPGAYKDAEAVQDQIKRFSLAEVVDRIMPLGSMMAGEQEKPWLKGKKR